MSVAGAGFVGTCFALSVTLVAYCCFRHVSYSEETVSSWLGLLLPCWWWLLLLVPCCWWLGLGGPKPARELELALL